MLFLQSQTSDPYFNIATEEYLLKKFDQDFFFLYINEPSIIVGKHQNTMAEVNVPYLIENNLKVVRRLSGGGTVFHDSGNLNYCFIQKGKEGFLVDFKKYTQPILNTLQSLGVNAYLRGKSDLVIDDLKFSGNAEHVYRKKILHHGTLLFDSQLHNLNDAIKSDWSKFEDKAVRSNRSKVTNIKHHLLMDLKIDTFADKVRDEVLGGLNNSVEYKLTETDVVEINNLIEAKYGSWDWNFGYSPKYILSQELELECGMINVYLEIEKGLICKARISLNDLYSYEFNVLQDRLLNQRHDYWTIYKIIDELLPEFSGMQCKTKELVKAFF